ncbi:MAG: beta-lactamase family protein [Actinomycetota bacterium]|nr:beta-lactamase family protein [Actinomycetota bacterium]
MTSTGLDPLAVVDGWPATAAAGVVGPDGAIASHGPTEEIFRLASVTKLLTTTALLVAVEEGTVALDDRAGPPGSTLRHLLAHASGLGRDGERVVAPPGFKRIYSNRGIEVAAATLEAASGVAFPTYLREAVLDPLGMTATCVEGSPASAGTAPLVDLMALARELLAPQVLAPETLEAATAVTFPNLDGVLPGFGHHSPNDWGVGFEIRDHKSPHWTGTTNAPATFGHFGLAGSFVWVDPVARLAGVCLSDTDFGPWAVEAWPPLADAVLTHYGTAPQTLRR